MCQIELSTTAIKALFEVPLSQTTQSLLDFATKSPGYSSAFRCMVGRNGESLRLFQQCLGHPLIRSISSSPRPDKNVEFMGHLFHVTRESGKHWKSIFRTHAAVQQSQWSSSRLRESRYHIVRDSTCLFHCGFSLCYRQVLTMSEIRLSK